MASLYNYAAAFVEFSRGTSPEDISVALTIPLDLLKTKIRDEHWKRLAVDFALPTPAPSGKAERDLAKIEANRAKNLEIAQRLQANLLEIVMKLQNGELLVERVSPKGAIVKLPPSLKDLRDLSGHARDVAELSYRALGDVVAGKEEGGWANGGTAQQITIVLPGPVVEPRQQRAFDVDCEVVSAPALPEGLVIRAGTSPGEGKSTSEVNHETATTYIEPEAALLQPLLHKPLGINDSQKRPPGMEPPGGGGSGD